MILADNGSSWFISGAPDAGWNNDDLHILTTIAGSNFEAVDATVLMVNPDSGQAVQSGVTVSVSPSSASVPVNTKKQFTATVSGSSNPAVTWDVNGTVGGNGTVGFIDSASGTYTAPLAPPSPATVTVHASSSATTPPAVGSASVTVTNPPPPPPPPVGISISPTSASVRVKTTKQFTGSVTNATNKSVTWKVNGVTGGSSVFGTISTSGLYKAPNNVPSPATFSVTAISVADTTKSASASVTVMRK
jgi:hypothetical protein